MSHGLSQIQRPLLKQEQRLTPQLIQAMDILQLNALALESRVAQEIDNNPALEWAETETETPEPGAEAEPSASEAAAAAPETEGPTFERLDDLVREYGVFEEDGNHQGTKSRARLDEEGDSKLEAMANAAARPVGLQEYLLQQWRLVDVDANTRRLGIRLIEDLDENGRLTTPLEQLAASLDPPAPVEELEAALRQVQQLDPPGVAARDLQECLLLQLAALPGDNQLERRTIQEHFEDLRKNRLPDIAKALGVEVEEIKAAIAVIGQLSLHPGLEIAARATPAMVPDVLVEYDAERDRYDVRLTRPNTRELRISPEFREALEKARDSKPDREFLKQKIEAANAIIDAVKFRRERLLEVAKAVVEAQRDFLDQGEQRLKVLRMSDLAARFGCDPSTISRTVDEKYIQTPRGAFPLRRFFTGGAETESGEALGWDSIKAKVREIVDAEDKSGPLSDDEIVEKLAALGIHIKRRTVAKYRDQLKIPTARQRRRY